MFMNDLKSFEHLNLYKLIFASLGAFLIIITNYFLRDKGIWLYSGFLLLSWLFVGYAISLKSKNEDLWDIDYDKLYFMIPSAIFIALGNISLVLFEEVHPYYFYFYAIGILLYILGKSGVISTELELIYLTQFLVIFSTALLVMGRILDIIFARSRNKTFSHVGKIINIIGWSLFVINVAHAPPTKGLRTLLIQK